MNSQCRSQSPSSDASSLAQLTREQRERLTDVLERYLAALENGAPLSQEAILAEQPDIAPALISYFRSLEALHDMAAGFAGSKGRAEEPADKLPVDKFLAPLAVISIESKAVKDADAVVTVDDVLAWEKQHGRLPAGAFVAMHSGWASRIGTAARFLNKDAKGTMHAPGFSEDAATFLTKQRDIVGAGVDTLSLDIAAASKFVAHLAFLGAGKYGVELLANLNAVPASGATIIVGGPKHEGASGGPCRVYAIV